MLYLTIREGDDDDPENALPIFGTTDPELIRGVADLLRRRLGGRDAAPLRQVGRALDPKPPGS
jgi:hypothetical protein